MSGPQGRRLGGRLALMPVRWSGLALAVGFAASALWVEAAVAMLVALGQVVGWRSRLPLPWEIAGSMICLSAAVSSFLGLYEKLTWWDLPMHVALNGVLAVLVARVVAMLAARRAAAGAAGSPSPSATMIVGTGVVLGLVWELMELAGNRWVDPSVHVTPADTVGDLVAGLVGTAAAAALWHRGWGRSESRKHHTREVPPDRRR